MTAHKTQAAQVLEHLQSGQEITSLVAMELYGIIQLPRRIFDLRQAGYNVISDQAMVENRRREIVRISVYRLRDKEDK